MKVGIVGAGNIGAAVARLAAKAGHEVVISNRRGLESLATLVAEIGPSMTAGTVRDSVDGDLVVLAVKWDDVPEAGAAIPDWSGRIVVDTTNAIGRAPDLAVLDVGVRLTSQIVQEHLPGARIVKTLNTFTPAILEKDPNEAGGQRVQFVSGDDPAARAKVTELVESFGFAVVDLGDLAHGSPLQQFPGGVLPRLNLVKLPEVN